MGKRLERKSVKQQQPVGLPSLTGAAIFVLDRALLMAAIAVGGSIFYMLQALISGSAAAFPNTPQGNPLSPEVQQRFLHGLHVVSYVFMGCIWAIMVVSIFRFRENDVAGYVGGLGGVLCYFVLPWIVRSSLIHFNANPNDASDFLMGAFRATGKLLLITAAIYFGGKTIVRLATRRQRAPATTPPIVIDSDKPEKPVEKLSRRRTLLRKCWELSMCRESLRENCPSWKLGATCWKRGTGCQCDPLLAQRLIEELESKLRGDMPDRERVARERMKEQLSYRVAEHQGDSFCRTCPIYTEHQFYKYRSFYWIAYPITAAIVFVLMPVIHKVYVTTDAALSKLLASVQLLPTNDEALAPFVRTMYHFDAEFIFVISAALIIAAYLLDLVDWAFFEARL